MDFARYAITRPVNIWILVLTCLLGGILAFFEIGRLEDPEFTIKQAIVNVQYPGATALEVEQQVTEPLESAIQQMSQIKEIRSRSMPGIAEIRVEMQDRYDGDALPQIWDELRNKINDAQGDLPPGIEPPQVNDDFGDVYGIFYALTGDGLTLKELHETAKDLRRALLTADGVGKVEIAGVQEERILVEVDQAQLAAMNIAPDEIAAALGDTDAAVEAGGVNAGDFFVRLRPSGAFDSLEELRALSVGQGPQRVELGAIAKLSRDYAERPQQIIRHNGQPALTLGISGVSGANIVEVGHSVEAVLQAVEHRMPLGAELHPLYEQHRIVDESVNSFALNVFLSVAIVVGVLCIAMGLRAGVIIGAVLFLTVLGTLLVMWLAGIELERISLGALIIAMGMLVDNAIVVTDNAQIAIARGVNRRKALIDGATGPQWGLLGATFIAICSFLPLYLAPSAVAEIVKPLFVVLAISLGLSWVLALTQTTVFGNFILKAKTGDSTKDPYDKPFYHKFASVLGVLIRKKAVTLVSMVILFIISLIIMGTMPQNFFPSLDKPYFRADVFYPDGYSINDVVKEMKSVEEHLAKQPEVKKVSITFGSTPLRYYLASTSVGPKPNFANVLVELTDSKYTKEYEEDFDGYMKANYPSAITRTSLFKLSPAVDAAIEIGFIGPNVDTLVSLTNQAIAIMHQNPDLINIRNSWGNKIPVWKPVYSPERAQPLGVSRQGMAQSIQIGTTGMTLGEYRQGDQVLPILLKNNQLDSFRINDLRTLPVFGTGNETTSLEQVVSEFDFQYRFSNVKDYNRQMVMMAQCDPRRGTNAISAFNQVWSQVQQEIKIPEGYTMKYFGEQESQVESNEALAKNLPLTFFLMFVTLLFLFKTYRKPTVILLMLPLIFIGIVLGLLVLGKSFDFFSILGLLGLIGMNIKNAIVLVDQIDLETAAGKKPLDAVISATTSRIIPVAMASGTTILGMLPLLFDAMFGGMAATIMGGLLVASALTLFVLPVAYCAIHRIKGEQ